ncbi:MAG: hypothetical protein CFH21_00123 [Alphaproteobacteria bacterium MarineAlpha5_Bin11]|nr:hypothetical protein [Pelagibacteraceae bacterium]PPR44951.1 MAG: hypothetical protein CFH21_00123 [Alphaproteobacteria bacterium MarineAlpha5_Bin11]|tara:strand:- start:523 stop:1512 length:990 start_codon:yes stop_codon:yes gene_type:complete
MKFKKLSSENIDDFIKVANNSKHKWHFAVDVVELELRLKNYQHFNLIIYKDDCPVAVFLSRNIKLKRLLVKLNGLLCDYQGLHIDKNFTKYSNEIINFLYNDIFDNYFKKVLKIDRIEYIPPPSLIFSNSQIDNFNIHKYGRDINKTNFILSVKKDDNYLKSRSYNIRYEIKKGLKNLESYEIISDKKKIDIEKILILDSLKSKRLNIEKQTKDFFYHRLKSKFYNFFIISMGDSYEVIYITANHENFKTLHYTCQSDTGRKKLLSKALMYKIINDLEENQQFLLGVKNDVSGVDFFKSNFANQEVKFSSIIFPISIKARFIQSLNKNY